MEHKNIRILGAAIVVTLWGLLAVFAWFSPSKEISEAERRKLAQMPPFKLEDILDGSFMTDFEEYTLDQFPARDTFRQLKARFHKDILRQKDNNDIYIADGYAAKLDYPLNESAVAGATSRFDRIYRKYLAQSNSKIYASVIPDKGYYLAAENGYLTMDYDALFAQVREQMPWASYVDITGSLSGSDYYRTDTHWRQEKILGAAQLLCDAMGVTGPKAEDYTAVPVERPFYGVYYGQAALPMASETMYLMESDLLKECAVYNYTTGSYGQVYDKTKLSSMDLYDLYLSGSETLLTIENPNAATDKELIIFRDSFGSSIAPLLVQDYARVTLVDIRYMSLEILDRFLTFNGQDVLFLYSTLVLNNPDSFQTA